MYAAILAMTDSKTDKIVHRESSFCAGLFSQQLAQGLFYQFFVLPGMLRLLHGRSRWETQIPSRRTIQYRHKHGPSPSKSVLLPLRGGLFVQRF